MGGVTMGAARVFRFQRQEDNMPLFNVRKEERAKNPDTVSMNEELRFSGLSSCYSSC